MAKVTSIQGIYNARNSSILFMNSENSGQNRDIPSSRYVGTGNCWIPWCWESKGFASHHIVIVDESTSKVLWYIWQGTSPDVICASQTGYGGTGPHINGESRTGKSLDLNVGPGDNELIAYVHES
jgi:hypothetical protein